MSDVEDFEDEVPDEEFDVEEDDDDGELEIDSDDDDLPVADEEVVDEVEDEVEDAEVPARRKKAAVVAEEEEDDDEEADPDDVEADLDTILKDRIASGDDLDDEEEEEVPDRNDPDVSDGVAAKKEGEFTCTGCYMIVHPRQFGRRDAMVCPEGYDPCPAMKVVAKMR